MAKALYGHFAPHQQVELENARLRNRVSELSDEVAALRADLADARALIDAELAVHSSGELVGGALEMTAPDRAAALA